MAPCCLWPRLFLLIQEARRLGETPQSDCLPLPRYMLCIIFKNKIKAGLIFAVSVICCVHVCVCVSYCWHWPSAVFSLAPQLSHWGQHTHTHKEEGFISCWRRRTRFSFSALRTLFRHLELIALFPTVNRKVMGPFHVGSLSAGRPWICVTWCLFDKGILRC